MSRKEFLIEQLHKVRTYTTSLVDAIPESDYFRFPAEGVTHIAWQVGHLAIVEYRLTIQRRRGTLPEDEQLISSKYVELFGKDSVPVADPSAYPPAAEIRKAFDMVHQRAMSELVETTEEILDEPVSAPHPMFTDKGAAIQWCAMHEMLHAGQIGLLRRLFGYKWLR